jgi:hypothetical protein
VACHEPDDYLVDVISEKMSKVPGISYSAVAYAAYQKKKPDLAARVSFPFPLPFPLLSFPKKNPV